jgi:hypothetical protein
MPNRFGLSRRWCRRKRELEDAPVSFEWLNDLPDSDFIDHVQGAMSREFMLTTFLAASALPETTAADWQAEFDAWASQQPRRYSIAPAAPVGGRDAIRVSALPGCAVHTTPARRKRG